MTLGAGLALGQVTGNMRRTLSAPVEFQGTGLHGGQSAHLTVTPASAGHGIVFYRSDVANGRIPARFDLVSDTRLCTKLTNEAGVSVGTVEHLMAALAGCGISDALVELDGPEVPIMDGSSAGFVDAFVTTGVVSNGEPLAAIRILRTVSVESEGRFAELAPAARFEMSFRIDFDDRAIGIQNNEMALVNGAFVDELSDCRTFGHLAEVEMLRAAGLARGGNLTNAIVVDQGRVLNPEGLRRPDEFVRHKMLDAIGDLALAGAPIIGRYSGDKAGHEMTNLLLHALFAQPDAWAWDVMSPEQGLGGELPVRQPVGDAEELAV